MPCPLCLAGLTGEHTKEDWARLSDPTDPLAIRLAEVHEERRIERERLIKLDPANAFLCG